LGAFSPPPAWHRSGRDSYAVVHRTRNWTQLKDCTWPRCRRSCWAASCV